MIDPYLELFSVGRHKTSVFAAPGGIPAPPPPPPGPPMDPSMMPPPGMDPAAMGLPPAPPPGMVAQASSYTDDDLTKYVKTITDLLR